MMTATRTRPGTWSGVLAGAALLALTAAAASAADWPTFKPGLWQFDRTIEGLDPAPQKVSRKDCIDPTADQKAQQAKLTKAGCQMSPITQAGTTYRYTATCRMAGMTTTSSSVLVFQGPEAYTLTVDSTVDGEKTHEVLTARRLGDCAK